MSQTTKQSKTSAKASSKKQVVIDEAIIRQMIAGQVPLSENIIREDPDIPEDTQGTYLSEETTKQTLPAEKPQFNLSQVSGTTSESRRKRILLPDFEQTFFAPVNYRYRAAIYVSAETKRKALEIVRKIGGERTTFTAFVENMLRFVFDIYREEINRIYQERNTKTLL